MRGRGMGDVLRLELTGADVERTLRLLAQQIPLEQIVWNSALCVSFTVAAGDLAQVERIAARRGDRIQIQSRTGLVEMLKRWMRLPLLTATVGLMLLLSLWIPSRIFFIQVQGNEQIPARMILECAGECGLGFGSARAEIRSEQLKNQLLERMPQLRWVGVNTAGCVAVITVREREQEPQEEVCLPGNLVAQTDAVVTELTATAGVPLCRTGDAVKAGQVLISGITDLGLCTHIQAAQGEVYGLTRREIQAEIPVKTGVSGDQAVTVKKYGLIFGKNRINFYSDSGILYPGCGKMTQIRMLQLPGGWTLPVGWVTETYTVCQIVQTDRDAQTAREYLHQSALALVRQRMIAGSIQSGEEQMEQGDGVFRLTAQYACREMIARRSSPITMEGETQENGTNG